MYAAEMNKKISDNTGHSIADTASKEMIQKIQDDLNKILKKYGNMMASELLVNKFPTTRFIPDMKKNNACCPNQSNVDNTLPTDTLYYFLCKASKVSKTKASNLKRKNPKHHKEPTNVKMNVDIDVVPNIDDMVYSDVVDIFNLADNRAALERIIVHTENKSMINKEVAIENLQGLDIHLLLNIIQNNMLALDLTAEIKKGVQGLRACRNLLVHLKVEPPLAKLKGIGNLLSATLTILNTVKERQPDIDHAIDECFAILNRGQIADDLRRELIRNVPDVHLISRCYTLHEDGYQKKLRSSNDLCNWIASYTSKCALRLKLAGNVCSGRTSALLDIYKHWAVHDSSINKRFKLIMPLVDISHCFGSNVHAESKNKQSPEEASRAQLLCIVEAVLKRWAPACLSKYGLLPVSEAVNHFQDHDVLSLIDQYNGYFNISMEWDGPSVETDLITTELYKEMYNIEEECKYPTVNKTGALDRDEMGPIAELLYLTENEVEAEICSWSGNNSHYHILYTQFQNRKLLTCPHALTVFREVTSKVTNKLEFDVMKALVKNGHEWVRTKGAQQKNMNFVSLRNPEMIDDVKQMEMCRIAYEHILAGNTSYDLKCLPFYPPYFIGNKEGPLFFKSLFLEDYLAALYVVEHVNLATWKWLKNTVKFQRVFKFVLQLWEEADAFEENKNHIYNYLSVYLDLYQISRSGRRKNDFNWNKPRPKKWSLKSEGFEKPVDGSSFKKWNFLSHVDDASNGNPQVTNIVMELLCECKFWMLDWDKMSQSTVKMLNRVFYMMNSNVKHKNYACKLELIRLCGKANSPDRLPDVAKALQLLDALTSKLQVTIYYNTKDPEGCSDTEVLLQLNTATDHLLRCHLPISIYDGPLTLPASPLSLIQSASFSCLSMLRVTVYERNTVERLLRSFPPKLEYLSLSVDISQPSASFPMPHHPRAAAAAGALTQHNCRVRLALRYHGSFDILSTFGCFPRIHVLRLHGLYDAKNQQKAISCVSSLNVDCLVVKFVTRFACDWQQERRTDASDSIQWCYRLLISLAQSMPQVSRLIVNQLPYSSSGQLPQMVDQLKHLLPRLQRLVFQNSFVDVAEANEVLAIMDKQSSDFPAGNVAANSDLVSSHSDSTFTLRPRLSLEIREANSKHKPSGFELIFIGVYDRLPSDQQPDVDSNNIVSQQQHTSKTSPPSFDSWYISDLPAFIKNVYTCSLVHFCYEGYRGCYFYDEKQCYGGCQSQYTCKCNTSVETKLKKGPAFEVMISPTRDCRLHVEFNKEMFEELLKNSNALLPSLAAAQYLHIRCKQVTADSFMALAAIIYGEKLKQLSQGNTGCGSQDALENSGTFNDGKEDINKVLVDPFHVTVISSLDDSMLSTSRRGESDQRKLRDQLLRQECNNLKCYLPEAFYLSYAYFELLDPQDSTQILCYVRKTHQGDIKSNL